MHFKCLSLAGLRQTECNVIAINPPGTRGGGSGVDREEGSAQDTGIDGKWGGDSFRFRQL